MTRGAWLTPAITLVALASGAAADPGPRGWTLDERDAARLTVKAREQVFFGGAPTTATVQAWRAPDGRASFWITSAQAAVAEAQRDAAASAQLGELADTARRNGAQIDATAQRWDEPGKFLEATIAWRNPELGLRQLARTVIVADAAMLFAVTGECVLPLDAPPATAQACDAALATLQPLVEQVDARVALAIVTPAPGAPVAPATADTPAAPPLAPGTPAPPTSGDAPRLDAVPRDGIAPMTISSAPRERDRRPVYLGLGIIVLAAVFWWNRRRRDRFERDELGERPRGLARVARDDDDADDLHAAARGDAPKDEP